MVLSKGFSVRSCVVNGTFFYRIQHVFTKRFLQFINGKANIRKSFLTLCDKSSKVYKLKLKAVVSSNSETRIENKTLEKNTYLTIYKNILVAFLLELQHSSFVSKACYTYLVVFKIVE